VIYRGTSLSLWALEALVAVMAVAFAVWVALRLLMGLLVIAGAAVAAFLIWWAYLEVRDRIGRRRTPA